jgi:signal transduction histidine kinase
VYKQVFTEGSVRDYPLAIRHKSGKITDVLYNATVYRNQDGEIQGIFAAARDITHTKNLEKLLKDSERLAAIGATAGMVGHDIRNPLQSIISDLYLAKSDLASLPESEEKQSINENLDEIGKSVEYVNKIVQDLQDFARPVRPVAKATDLGEAIEDQFSKIHIPPNIRVSSRIEKDAKTVVADPDILKRILANLLMNAVQAMPDGGKLTVHTYKAADGVAVDVKDTGIGIPEDVKSKLFTPLFTTKSKGQGFGLAVVKRLTESLNGTVAFESQTGKGTTFTIKLPANKTDKP